MRLSCLDMLLIIVLRRVTTPWLTKAVTKRLPEEDWRKAIL
jgi:hypothetical protein